MHTVQQTHNIGSNSPIFLSTTSENSTPGEPRFTFAGSTHASLSIKPSPAMNTTLPPTCASNLTTASSTLAAASVDPPVRLVTSLAPTSRASTITITKSLVPDATPSVLDWISGRTLSKAIS